MSGVAVLRLAGVSVRFRDAWAVRDVTFEISAGEVVALVGPNGAGKTSTIRAVTGVVPFEGTIDIAGHTPGHIGARECVRWAPQPTSFTPELTVRQNLDFVEHLLDQRGRSAQTAATMMGLDDRLGQRADKLSGGLARRLHVASALIGEPRLLILDEPSVGMDLESRQWLIRAVRDLAAAGIAILYATHQVEEIESIAGRLVLLQEGRVVLDAPPFKFRHRLDDLFVRLVGPSVKRIPLPPEARDVTIGNDEVTFLMSGSLGRAEVHKLVSSIDGDVGVEIRPPTLEESIWSLLAEGGK